MPIDSIIRERELKLLLPLDGITSVLELGDKRWGNKPPYKTYFESRGIRHVSVDINGKNGSLRRDLRKPLDLGRFDCVTNFGTTEHVSVQEPVWRSICEACDKLFISTTPKPHTYPRHGLLYPSEEFYRELARLNGFAIERLYEIEKSKGVIMNVRMARVERVPFVMPDESLIIRNASTDRYTDLVEAAA